LRDSSLSLGILQKIRRQLFLWIAERLATDKRKVAREAFANPGAKVDNNGDKIDVGVKKRI
jgi:hypothetical protein